MDMLLESRVRNVLNDFSGRVSSLEFEERKLDETRKKRKECLDEIVIGERAQEVLQNVREMLRQGGIEECENLATEALKCIFGFNGRVVYDLDGQRFMLKRGGTMTDLCDGEGGGYVAVVSLVFQMYLVCKRGGRRFMFFDEAFTQISDEYFDKFIGFIHSVCNDLKFDILLVTHDRRIELSSVDHAYRIKDGLAETEK